MKGSLPRRRVIELFDELDGGLTVMAFSAEDGHRIFTYSCLNPFLALAEAAHRLAIGEQVRIVRRPFPPDGWGIENIADFPEDLAWNPSYKEIHQFKS